MCVSLNISSKGTKLVLLLFIVVKLFLSTLCIQAILCSNSNNISFSYGYDDDVILLLDSKVYSLEYYKKSFSLGTLVPALRLQLISSDAAYSLNLFATTTQLWKLFTL